MSFRFYIVDTFSVSVSGTNNVDTANKFASIDQYIVIDTLYSLTISPEGDIHIKDVKESA